MNTNIARAARTLLEAGSLARSSCSREFLAALAPMLDSGGVVEERSGAGRRLVVRDAAAFQDFIRHHFPDVAVAPDASSRLTGVARFRDTKSITSDLPEIVTLRAWHGDVLRYDGRHIAIAEATRLHGVFSFLLTDADRYTLHGPCALVENPAVFTQFEQLGLPPRLALYGHGRSSNRLLDWLAAQTAPDFQLLHFPDYDPVGLDEFIRLQERLGPRVRLHLPDNLTHLFACHSNRELLHRPSNQSLLARLRPHPDHAVRTVLKLIEQHNAGLEQEAMLITSQSNG
jgi:hypothetical protein